MGGSRSGPSICRDEVVADGDMVVLCWTAHRARAATSEGVTGMTRSRHVGGKIVESWTDWDRLSGLRRLNSTPRTGAAGHVRRRTRNRPRQT